MCRPRLRARPMIAGGAKCADSRKMSCVASVTRESKPPMTPATAKAASCVGDQQEGRIQRRVVAIEQLQRFAGARMAHHDVALQHVVVERMQRLAQFQHHVVGDVDHRADRAQTAAAQAFGHPQRRVRGHVDALR